MKINFVTQINPDFPGGGGEAVNRSLLAAGNERNHHIKVTAAFPDLTIDLFDKPDMVIFGDIYNQPSARSRLDDEIIRDLTSGPYMLLDNAYTGACDLGYLPCNGETDGKKCRHKRSFGVQSHRLLRRRGCFAQETVALYRDARLSAFVSPLHRRVMQNIQGIDVIGDYFELRPTVDTAVFYDRGGERDIENLFVGTLSEAKGMNNLKRMFPSGDITLAGPAGPGADTGFGRWLGPVDYSEIPGLMNRARNFVYLPRWPEPMGRVVVEAALCGCNLLTNGNVGATSFDFDIGNHINMEGATSEFWEKVEAAVSSVLGQTGQESGCA
jgi:hypothetical protein